MKRIELINNSLSNDGRDTVGNAVLCNFNPFLLKVTDPYVLKTSEKDFWCVQGVWKFSSERKLI